MCKAIEDMRRSVAIETEKRTRTEMAMDMIKDGKLPLELIAQYSRLAIESVKELASQAGTKAFT